MATEFVQGGDLRHLMKSKKTFPEDAAKFIIANLILGLEFIHHNGILHRDIRPENILIASTGYLKICDFGLARIWTPENSTDSSGNPCYMAPEVLFKHNHTMTADYFSLGVIAHELMLGRKPYDVSTRDEYKEALKTQ